jgi:hypothetical protein
LPTSAVSCQTHNRFPPHYYTISHTSSTTRSSACHSGTIRLYGPTPAPVGPRGSFAGYGYGTGVCRIRHPYYVLSTALRVTCSMSHCMVSLIVDPGRPTRRYLEWQRLLRLYFFTASLRRSSATCSCIISSACANPPANPPAALFRHQGVCRLVRTCGFSDIHIPSYYYYGNMGRCTYGIRSIWRNQWLHYL